MIVTTIGSRGICFTFPDLSTTNVYVINCKHRFYVCDTFLGPDAMAEVRSHLEKRYGNKQYVVFNSHADWDHIWGNCAFAGEVIIAHDSATNRIIREWDGDIARFHTYMKGRVSREVPSVSFDSSITFRDDNVTFFHSPGHTLDSSSCFDLEEHVLFAGDNVEEPVPYTYQPDLALYLRSLKRYLDMAPSVVLPGHGLPASTDLVSRNMHYLERLQSGNPPEDDSDEARSRHVANVKALILAGWGIAEREQLH